MATVSNVQLEVGKRSDGKATVRVRYDVAFSAAEVQLNLSYPEIVRVFDIDSNKDIYTPSPNFPGGISQGILATDNQDDLIVELRNGALQPNQQALVHREWEGIFTPGTPDADPEEYEALIHIASPFPWVFQWTPRVTLDVGSND